MNLKFLFAGVVAAVGTSAVSAEATTFAIYSPVAGATNIGLSGLSLTASAPVIFDYELWRLRSLRLETSAPL